MKKTGSEYLSYLNGRDTGNRASIIAQEAYIGIAGPPFPEHVPDRMWGILDGVAKSVRSDTHLEGAKMAVEMAAKTKDGDQTKMELLGKAKDLYERVLESQNRSSRLNIDGFNAGLGLAVLPAFGTLALLDSLPKMAVQEKLQAKLLSVLGETLTFSETFKRGSGNLSRIVGLQSELVTLILFNRFALKELSDGSQLALPSFYSEDHGAGHGHGSTVTSGWDVSVFSSSEEDLSQPKVLHKIQVKTKVNQATNGRDSTDEVTRFHVQEDLAVTPKEKRLGQTTIFAVVRNLCLDQDTQSTRDSVARILNERTDALLELLG